MPRHEGTGPRGRIVGCSYVERRPFGPGDTGLLAVRQSLRYRAGYDWGAQIAVSHNRITVILKGARSVTADTAILLAHRFGTSARFWLNLQIAHDLAVASVGRRTPLRQRGEGAPGLPARCTPTA